MSEAVQTPQCIAGDLVQVVVTKSQVLEVFFKNNWIRKLHEFHRKLKFLAWSSVSGRNPYAN